MNIMWCRNNLKTVGKWGGAGFVFGLAVTALFMFGVNRPVRAYVIETVPTAQPTQLKIDLNSVSKLNDITAPVTNLLNGVLKSFGLNQNINIGTGTPLSPIKSPSQTPDFSKFFSSSSVSTNDVMSFLKQAAVTGINMTILIFSIASQVLKGLLSVFK